MKKQDNFLEYIPKIKEGISWKPEQGHVIIDMENKGLANRIAQICFGRPKVSHITLEELGSFIWQQIDGEKSILQIGELVQEAFGEKAEPLYGPLHRSQQRDRGHLRLHRGHDVRHDDCHQSR